jgi:hypothetical protein
VRGLFVAIALGGCVTPTQSHRETFETLTADLPDYAPIPDDRVRLEADLRGMVGGFTVGGAHSFAGGAALTGGVRHDALSIRVEGEALGLGLLAESRNEAPGPLGAGTTARLLRAGGACLPQKWQLPPLDAKTPQRTAPPTEIDRMDVFIEGGAGEEWITAGMNSASRGDLEVGVGLELGPRHATDHWGLELGLRMLLAHSLDSSRVDHPVMFVMGGVIGS